MIRTPLIEYVRLIRTEKWNKIKINILAVVCMDLVLSRLFWLTLFKKSWAINQDECTRISRLLKLSPIFPIFICTILKKINYFILFFLYFFITICVNWYKNKKQHELESIYFFFVFINFIAITKKKGFYVWDT